MIRFACPTCQTALKVPPNLAGKMVPCPRCDDKIKIPMKSDEEGAAKPKPAPAAARIAPKPKPVEEEAVDDGFEVIDDEPKPKAKPTAAGESAPPVKAKPKKSIVVAEYDRDDDDDAEDDEDEPVRKKKKKKKGKKVDDGKTGLWVDVFTNNLIYLLTIMFTAGLYPLLSSVNFDIARGYFGLISIFHTAWILTILYYCDGSAPLQLWGAMFAVSIAALFVPLVSIVNLILVIAMLYYIFKNIALTWRPVVFMTVNVFVFVFVILKDAPMLKK